MSDSKINVKVGIVEFSGEGNQEWLASQLDKILDRIPELLRIEVSSNSSAANKSGDESIDDRRNLSVLNIAGKLNAKSGTELAMVAAAYLHFIERKSEFSREEISTAMKKATGIYKHSILANLTTSLATLEKNGHLLKSGTFYSIGMTKLGELNATLFS